MKLFSIVALSLASVVAGQAACAAQANGLNSCVKNCIDEAGKGQGCKGGPEDLKCLCDKMTAIEPKAKDCVAACKVDANSATIQAKAVCACVKGI